jgi:hypothetical protein
MALDAVADQLAIPGPRRADLDSPAYRERAAARRTDVMDALAATRDAITDSELLVSLKSITTDLERQDQLELLIDARLEAERAR